MDQFENPTVDEVEEPLQAAEPQEEPSEPVFVNIRYAGQSYQVPEHIADAWQKREDDFNRKLSQQGAELGQLRRQSRPPEPQPESVQPTEDEDLAFFQSPSKAISQREARLREQLKQELKQELTLEQQRQQYWNQFYQENPELKSRERLVNFIVAEQYESLKDLSPAESQREIARMVRETLGNPAQEAKALPNRQAVTERPSNSRPQPRQAPQEPSQPRLTGLSAELAARAERRRKAQYNTREEK